MPGVCPQHPPWRQDRPEKSAPGQDYPEKSAPGQDYPEKSTPGQDYPEKSTPGHTAPGSRAHQGQSPLVPRFHGAKSARLLTQRGSNFTITSQGAPY